MSKDFYISYSGADQAWAEWIGWVLEEAGYTVVLQAWDFRPGSNFALEMQQAAAQAARTITVFSPDFLASRFTASEWAAAFARDPTGALRLLLPVRVRECEPNSLLPQIVYIDLLGLEDKAAARDRLLTGVKREWAKPAGEPAFPASAMPTRRREIPEEPRFPGALQDEDEWGVESLQGDPRKGNMGMAQRSSAEWELLEELLASGLFLEPGDAEGVAIEGVPRMQPPRPPIRFTVFHPSELISEQWDTMLVYTHIPDKQVWVYEDAQARLKGRYGQRHEGANRDIAEGAEIVVVPELPGCQFNPPTDRFQWLEDVHRREFRLKATRTVPGFAPGTAINGRVALYVSSILIAEVVIWAFILDQQSSAIASNIIQLPAASTRPTGTSHITGWSDPYSAIFVSYAHEDSAVVHCMGVAYKALGMTFLRDQEVLRSGERWNHTLLALIEKADIFQLFWSNAARQSHYVKQEWRHALKQERDNFIRPVYWQQPLPTPPRKLRHLHFTYLGNF